MHPCTCSYAMNRPVRIYLFAECTPYGIQKYHISRVKFHGFLKHHEVFYSFALFKFSTVEESKRNVR